MSDLSLLNMAWRLVEPAIDRLLRKFPLQDRGDLKNACYLQLHQYCEEGKPPFDGRVNLKGGCIDNFKVRFLLNRVHQRDSKQKRFLSVCLREDYEYAALSTDKLASEEEHAKAVRLLRTLPRITRARIISDEVKECQENSDRAGVKRECNMADVTEADVNAFIRGGTDGSRRTRKCEAMKALKKIAFRAGLMPIVLIALGTSGLVCRHELAPASRNLQIKLMYHVGAMLADHTQS